MQRPRYAILGATGGIGSALCRRLAARGADLILGARSAEPLEKLAHELPARFQPVDCTSSAQVDQFFAWAQQQGEALDGVAHCVGALLIKPAHRTSDAEWAEVIARNLTSAFLTVRAATQLRVKSIVLLSSAAALHGMANHEGVAAAKAGIVGLMRAAAATYAARGVRVNAVAPGLIETSMTAKLLAAVATRQASARLHPAGRIGTADEVASAIAWLLDPEQAWVTGQVLGVDGGLSTLVPTLRQEAAS